MHLVHVNSMTVGFVDLVWFVGLKHVLDLDRSCWVFWLVHVIIAARLTLFEDSASAIFCKLKSTIYYSKSYNYVRDNE